jgi:6-phosphogluconolactonase
MYIPNLDLESAEKECTNIYINELYPFDVIILGMGNDAHTASLFPNNEKLQEAFDLNSEKLCISIKPKTAPYDRMSLNLKAILSAKNIFLHIEGKEKLEVYNRVLKSDDKFEMPILSLLKQEIKQIKVFAYE